MRTDTNAGVLSREQVSQIASPISASLEVVSWELGAGSSAPKTSHLALSQAGSNPHVPADSGPTLVFCGEDLPRKSAERQEATHRKTQVTRTPLLCDSCGTTSTSRLVCGLSKSCQVTGAGFCPSAVLRWGGFFYECPLLLKMAPKLTSTHTHTTTCHMGVSRFEGIPSFVFEGNNKRKATRFVGHVARKRGQAHGLHLSWHRSAVPLAPPVSHPKAKRHSRILVNPSALLVG